MWHAEYPGTRFELLPKRQELLDYRKAIQEEIRERLFKETNIIIKREGKRIFGRGDRLTGVSRGIRQ